MIDINKLIVRLIHWNHLNFNEVRSKGLKEM